MSSKLFGLCSNCPAVNICSSAPSSPSSTWSAPLLTMRVSPPASPSFIGTSLHGFSTFLRFVKAPPSTDHMAPSWPPSCDRAANSVSSIFLTALFPYLESLFRPTLPTLHHVPKRTRNAWASLGSILCSDISRDPSCLNTWTKYFMLPRCNTWTKYFMLPRCNTWTKYFMLPQCVLSNLVKGGQSNWRNTLSLTRSCIHCWKLTRSVSYGIRCWLRIPNRYISSAPERSVQSLP